MRTIVNHPVVAALIGLVLGVAVGSVVALAMGGNLHMYLRFVGLLAITAVVIVGVWVYRRFVHPESTPVVEEMEVGR